MRVYVVGVTSDRSPVASNVLLTVRISGLRICTACFERNPPHPVSLAFNASRSRPVMSCKVVAHLAAAGSEHKAGRRVEGPLQAAACMPSDGCCTSWLLFCNDIRPSLYLSRLHALLFGTEWQSSVIMRCRQYALHIPQDYGSVSPAAQQIASVPTACVPWQIWV